MKGLTINIDEVLDVDARHGRHMTTVMGKHLARLVTAACSQVEER